MLFLPSRSFPTAGKEGQAGSHGSGSTDRCYGGPALPHREPCACRPPRLELTPTQLDLNPVAWALSERVSPDGDELSLESALDQIIIFCNAHLALRHENALAVFAAGFGKRCGSG